MKHIKSFYPLLIPTIISAVLLSIDLSTRSLWIDEGASLSIASQSGQAFANALARDGGNMIIYYLMLHLIIKIFGDSPIILRLPAVIGGVLSVLGVALVCSKLFNNLMAFTSAVLTSLSLPFIYWSQNARSYTLLEAAVIWSYYFFIMMLSAREDNRLNRHRHLFGYGVCILLGTYMSFIAVLVVIPQFILLLQYRKPLKQFIEVLVIDAVLCIPLGWLALMRGSSQLFWIGKPSWQLTAPIIQFLASTGVDNNFNQASSGFALNILTYIFLAVGLLLWITMLLHKKVSAAYFRYYAKKIPQGKRTAQENQFLIYQNTNVKIANKEEYVFGFHLVLWWLLLPSLAILIESWLGQSIYNPKYFLPFAAPVSIIICYILFSDTISCKVGLYVGSGIFLLVAALRLASVIPTYGVSPENWEEPTNYLIQNARQNDCIAFYPADTRTLIVYYLQQNDKKWRKIAASLKPILPKVALTKMPSYVEDYYSLSPKQLESDAQRCPRMWLVSSHQGNQDGTKVSVRHYYRFFSLYDNIARLYPVVHTNTYGWSSPVDVTLFQH